MVPRSSQSGFALLITMVVVGVIVSIGLTILDLSLKQVRLSTNAKESEISFHAANAGMECARYWRRQSSVAMTSGAVIAPTCFSSSPTTNTRSQIPASPGSGARVVGNGQVFRYDYSFTWGVSPDVRCTQITTLAASTTPTGIGATTTNMTALIPGFKGLNNEWYCAQGSRCTVIAVRGYNQPCNAINTYGVVQREVLLQF